MLAAGWPPVPYPTWEFPIGPRFPFRPRAAAVGLALALAPGLAPEASAAFRELTRTAATTTTNPTPNAVVSYAKRFIGVPYSWGGSTPAGFDCSGFTSFVYARFGVTMAHSSYTQRSVYPAVARKNLRAGDLVFFSGGGHVGMYIGGGKFIHSPRSGTRVHIAKLTDGWYTRTYVGAVRPAAEPSRSTSGPSTRKPAGRRPASSDALRA